MYPNSYNATPYGARPPPYAGFPPSGPPPGMAPPPGLGAPLGLSHAPSMLPPGASANGAQSRPGLAPFGPPPNMPNINFSAPIIRLGTATSKGGSLPPMSTMSARSGQSGPGYLGPGGSTGRVLPEIIIPPTAEEMLRTLAIIDIPKDLDDDWIERILHATPRLRRWERCLDENDKPVKFGFGEYEDPDAFKIAIEALKDIVIPPVSGQDDGTPLQINWDEKFEDFYEKYDESIERPSGYEESKQARIDSTKQAIKAILFEYAKPDREKFKSVQPLQSDGPMQTDSSEDTMQPEIVTIQLTQEDELSDIPSEFRGQVAREIQDFRDRATKKELERIKREESSGDNVPDRPRMTRLASPPPASAPTGPSGRNANSIPVGPRSSGHSRQPPSGPASQMSRDFASTGRFVNGSAPSVANGVTSLVSTYRNFTSEEDDSSLSDQELERRRLEAQREIEDRQFYEQERKWQNRERAKFSAVSREDSKDKDVERRQLSEKDAMRKRLLEWNDDLEAQRKIEAYYSDHSAWIRNRTAFRQRELEIDSRDKLAEEKETEDGRRRKTVATNQADNFLARVQETLPSKEPQKFKLALGVALRKTAAGPSDDIASRRTLADVEGLLEDEEVDPNKTKRTLIPLKYDANDKAGSTANEESREKLVKQLASEIPVEKSDLFAWPVAWDFVDSSVISEKLQPFVEKKVVDYLGIQEQDLVIFILDHFRKREPAELLLKELEAFLAEDAEDAVKKLWRMLVFSSELEKRGLV